MEHKALKTKLIISLGLTTVSRNLGVLEKGQ